MTDPLLQSHVPVDVRALGASEVTLMAQFRAALYDADPRQERGYLLVSPEQFVVIDRICQKKLECEEAWRRRVRLFGYDLVVMPCEE